MECRSSCSDDGEYPDFCFQAANTDFIYNSFRRHPVYTKIVETVSKQAGKDYLQLALSKQSKLANYLQNFVSSEKVGSPNTFPYKHSFFSPKYSFSPTTLRYINVLSDLLHFFGDLNGKRIVEIGGGYGGLCKIISDFYNVNSYTLIDLQPCLQLSKRFLNDLSVPNVEYLTEEELSHNNEYDLVISNYAFSEIKREIQDVYMEKIIQKSQRGYLLCNFASHTWDSNQMSGQDFKQRIDGVVLFKNEYPLSQLDRDCGIELIVWGMEKLLRAKNNAC
ncbi:putative sugar O-methyltransferase [Pseudanabaena sp. UWO310]|uniref:putative sugar O-methyltransferase n=1 Tax=Pseudanabaena sp. UWO310 TaxID=2480795 RepID=UPI0011613CF4|nr:putative sugar O-methyltransferase [Pseudanabaena sp. UWO310]TYQ24023.1 putative sugar O-methyltransferase [Pseudanabaena sp. UWO310]